VVNNVALPTIQLSSTPTGSTTGSVTVTTDVYSPYGTISLQKWAAGNLSTTYFSGAGTVISGNEFTVSQNGEYTVYAKDSIGSEQVQTITINNIRSDSGSDSTGDNNSSSDNSNAGGSGSGSVPATPTNDGKTDLTDSPSKEENNNLVIQPVVNGQTAIVTMNPEALREYFTKNPDGALRVETPLANISIPASAISLDKWLQGSGTSPQNAKLKITIEQMPDPSGVMAEQFKQAGSEMLMAPTLFKVEVQTQTGTTQQIAGFDQFVTRSIDMGKTKVNPATAAVLLYDPVTQTYTSVPAIFETTQNGNTRAVINDRNTGLYVIVNHERTFADIQGHWAQQAIEKMASKYVADGISDQQFNPESPVSRGEFTVFMSRALGLNVSDQPEQPAGLTDTGASPYQQFIAASIQAGLIQGYEDGSFRPDQTITREEMAVLLSRVQDLQTGSQPKSNQPVPGTAFNDGNQIGEYAKDAVQKLSGAGIIQGGDNGEFRPKDSTSRAEALTMLERTLRSMGFIN
jgi:hypothetical protein